MVLTVLNLQTKVAHYVWHLIAPVVQVAERDAVDHQAQLLAFDRQNHMGASDRQASNLQQAIAEEADAQMQEKRVVNSAVNIAENKTKMKVRPYMRSHFRSADVRFVFSRVPVSVSKGSSHVYTTAKPNLYMVSLLNCDVFVCWISRYLGAC